ncbi:MAG: glycosyltransferase [Candidatus Aenigmatarchaeota archaeon]
MAKASVVIPVLNEEKKIENIIRQLLSQTVKPEIIIVDGGSTDNTLKIVKKYLKKFKNIKLYFEKGEVRSPANAMNIGWRKAKGDIILFSGVDFIFEKQYIEKIIKEFDKNPKADVICFVSRPFIIRRFPSLLSKISFYRLLSHEKFELIAFRKGIYKRVGFFNPRLGFGEDRDLFKRIKEKFQVIKTKTLVKWSAYAFNDFHEFFRRYLWYGRSIPRYLYKNPKDFGVLGYYLISISLIPSLILIVFSIKFVSLFLFFCSFPLLRGFFDGIKIWKNYKYLTPIFVLPFLELSSAFIINLGFFQFLLGKRKVGR